MTAHPRLAAIAACWVWLGLPGPASAEPSAADVQRAQTLTNTAAEAFKAGRHRDAADAYEAAYALVANPILLKNAVKVVALHTADCARVHRLADAYLATAPTQVRARGVAAYKAECHLQAAEAHLEGRRFAAGRAELERARSLDLAPMVVARVGSTARRLDAAEAAHAEVRIRVRIRDGGGAPLAVAPRLRLDGAAVSLDAQSRLTASRGAHTLDVSAPGYAPRTKRFSAAEDAVLEVALTPVVAAPVVVVEADPADPGRALRLAGYSALGVAAATLAGAVVVDAGGQSSADDARRVGAAGTDRDRYDALLDEVESAKLWSTVLYGGAAAAGLAGGVLLYLGWEAAPEQGAHIVVGPTSVSVSAPW